MIPSHEWNIYRYILESSGERISISEQMGVWNVVEHEENMNVIIDLGLQIQAISYWYCEEVQSLLLCLQGGINFFEIIPLLFNGPLLA